MAFLLHHWLHLASLRCKVHIIRGLLVVQRLVHHRRDFDILVGIPS